MTIVDSETILHGFCHYWRTVATFSMVYLFWPLPKWFWGCPVQGWPLAASPSFSGRKIVLLEPSRQSYLTKKANCLSNWTLSRANHLFWTCDVIPWCAEGRDGRKHLTPEQPTVYQQRVSWMLSSWKLQTVYQRKLIDLSSNLAH
jgi:hypothetical protein